MTNCRNYTYSEFIKLSKPKENPVYESITSNQHFNNASLQTTPATRYANTSLEIDMNYPNEVKSIDTPKQCCYNCKQTLYNNQQQSLIKQPIQQPIQQPPQPQQPIQPIYQQPPIQQFIPHPYPIYQYPQALPAQGVFTGQPQFINSNDKNQSNNSKSQEDSTIEFKTKTGKVVKFKAKKERKPKIKNEQPINKIVPEQHIENKPNPSNEIPNN